MKEEKFSFCCTCKHSKRHTERSTSFETHFDESWAWWECTYYNRPTPYDDYCGRWTERKAEEDGKT